MSEIECILFQDQLIRETWNRKYDWAAILYFIWRIFLKYAFKRPIPDKNKWESENAWFCNEILEIDLKQDLSMKSPNDLMLMLEQDERFISCEVFP